MARPFDAINYEGRAQNMGMTELSLESNKPLFSLSLSLCVFLRVSYQPSDSPGRASEGKPRQDGSKEILRFLRSIHSGVMW